MSNEILTQEQRKNYEKFPEILNENQISKYFTLDNLDLEFIQKRRGNANKLGVALQLTCVRFLGTFLNDLSEVPDTVKEFVAEQLSFGSITILRSYGKRETTIREHRTLIKKQYNYREYTKGHLSFRLTRLIYLRAWISDERPNLLFDLATSWLVKNKVLLPGATTLTRLIGEIRQRAFETLWKKLADLPSISQKSRLNDLLEISEPMQTSWFDYYRKGPVRISSTSFIKALKRYQGLRSFGIGELDFQGIPPIKIRQFAKHASITSAYRIGRMPEQRRVAVLVVFVKIYEVTALDDALDVLELLVTTIVNNAKRIGKKKRLRTLKDLDRSAVILAKVSKLVLDEKISDLKLRKSIYKVASKDLIENSMDTVNELARPENSDYWEEMIAQYGKIKKILPRLFEDIEFEAAPSGENLLDIFFFLASLQYDKSKFLENPPADIITPLWKKLIFDEEGNISKKGYTICFLNHFLDALKRRDIYIKNGDRWGDPRMKLLKENYWENNKNQICASLGHIENGKESVDNLVKELDATYKKVASNFQDNDSVSLDITGNQPSLTIKKLDRLVEPDSLKSLKESILSLLPKVDLTELLLEIQGHTNFIDSFSHVSESSSRSKDLTVSICAVLIAEACNIGIEPLVKDNIPALTRHRLNWVKQNYFREETLTKSNAKLVDYQSTLSLVNKWGSGMVASADGMRFVTPVQTINSGYNRKYFGANRGITWYNYMSDQFSGFHGIAVPGTLRDSMFILDGFLEQQTSLVPTEIMTDTAGTSEMVFGLFWLLGYQFSPRLADAGEAVFWRVDKNSDYGPLDDISRGMAKVSQIEDNWNDMLRMAGSLKLGTVRASELMKTLLKSDRPSGLAKAIREVGRINKTLYLLNYTDSQEYRRKILTQLNRGESRHNVARAICYGQRGEIRKRYKEGQENQLGALGLVTNAVILWNSIYIQKSIEYLETKGATLNDEDLKRLSPLIFKHINMLGYYSFEIEEKFLKGKLRNLGIVNEKLKNIP
ncbi:Tn3 family transposase [Maribacter sp.]|uniref:Tn3 family transposase n=1 Tax=Maribacter sp. TaxID=1897614 RepID=UPI0025B91DB8|nr:Tn3 family transposase [Maribacter sp.]